MAHPSDRSGGSRGGGAEDRQGDRPDDAHALGFADPLIGRIIGGNFRVLKLIGTGAMGHVYQAEQLSLGKMVAIKLLRNELMGDDKLIKRFELEARNASQLNHPNSIQIIDFGRDRDLLFIAMELLPGVDLGQLILREGPLPLGRIARIMDQVLAALDEAHAQGIVHRDLKPGNIMLVSRRGEPDFVKVCDFGIAKAQTSREGAGLTMKGLVCGTPEYMSPEQARGEEVDGRSDLYAVGVILYQLVTGELPFTASSPVGILSKHLAETPLRPTLRRPGLAIPPAFERVILRALAKDAEDRPQTSVELRQELRASAADVDMGEWSLTSPSMYAPSPGASSSRDLPTQPTTPMHVAQSGGIHRGVTSRASSGDLLPGAISRSHDGYGTSSTRRSGRRFALLLGVLVLGGAGTWVWLQRGALLPPAPTTAVTPADPGPPPAARPPEGQPTAAAPAPTAPPPTGEAGATPPVEQAPEAALAANADPPAAAAAADKTISEPARQRRAAKRGRRAPAAAATTSTDADTGPAVRPEAAVTPSLDPTAAPAAAPARTITSAPTHADQTKEQPMKEAERLLAQGEVASACKKGEEQRVMTPKLPGIYKFLGKCYMRAGQPERAKDNYRRYLELAPDASDAAFIKSIVR